MAHVDLDDQIERGIDRRVDLGRIPDEAVVLEVEAGVGLEALVQLAPPVGGSPHRANVHAQLLGHGDDRLGQGEAVLLVLRRGAPISNIPQS